MSRPKLFAWLLLTAIFAANLVETALEGALVGDRVRELGFRVAHAFSELEPDGLFAHHEASGPIAVFGYSLSYFFVFPLLALALAVTLSCRADDGPFRLFARALAIDYGVSLPFFLLFPIPERWAYPESGAMLLSDQWTSALIEAVRPMSGLDNCFPSFHVSMTVVMIGASYLAGVRLRGAVAGLGGTVILSTLGLGIHWLPDIVAGVALGVLSVALALRLEPGRRLAAPPVAAGAPA